MLTKAVAQGFKKGASGVVAMGRPAGQAADVEHVASLRQRGKERSGQDHEDKTTSRPCQSADLELIACRAATQINPACLI